MSSTSMPPVPSAGFGLPDVLADTAAATALLVLVLALAALLLCVGAVTTLRWCDARLVALLRRGRTVSPVQYWRGEPIHPVPAPPSPRGTPVPAAWSPATSGPPAKDFGRGSPGRSTPLRSGPGPRDW